MRERALTKNQPQTILPTTKPPQDKWRPHLVQKWQVLRHAHRFLQATMGPKIIAFKTPLIQKTII